MVDYLGCINQYILSCNFKKAKDRLDEMKDNYSYKNQKQQINLLYRKLNERSRKNDIYGGKLADKYKKVLIDAKLSEYYGDYYSAYQYYLYGLYLTNDVSLYFNIGICKYMMGEHEEASNYFLKYIDEGGYSNLSLCYFILADLKNVFNSNERSKFHEKYVKTDKLMKEFKDNIKVNKIKREEPLVYSYGL